MDYAQIAQEAGILLLIIAPASAAAVDLVKRVIPALRGDWAATIAGVLSMAATTCALRPMLPEVLTLSDWIMLIAIVLLAGYSPKIVRDVARAPRKAAEHIAMVTEWGDGEQGEGA